MNLVDFCFRPPARHWRSQGGRPPPPIKFQEHFLGIFSYLLRAIPAKIFRSLSLAESHYPTIIAVGQLLL